LYIKRWRRFVLEERLKIDRLDQNIIMKLLLSNEPEWSKEFIEATDLSVHQKREVIN
jgi:hypothetical protein